MKAIYLAAMISVLCLTAGGAIGQTIEQLEKQVQDNPTSASAGAALAEAYLRDCQLEKSLKLWQAILAKQPDNARAKLVIERLTAQALGLDTQLDTLSTLIDRGVFAGTDTLLDAAAQRAASNSQKANIYYLRGRLALQDAQRPVRVIVPAAAPTPVEAFMENEDAVPSSQPTEKDRKKRSVPKPAAPAFPTITPTWQAAQPADVSQESAARSCFEAAMKIAPDSAPAAKSAMSLAMLDMQTGHRDAAVRLLRQVADNPKLADAALKQTAKFRLVEIASQDLAPAERIAAFEELLTPATAAPVRRMILQQLVAMSTAMQGRWTPESVDYLGAMLAVSPSGEEASAVLADMAGVAAASQDAATLDKLIAIVKNLKTADPSVARQGQILLVEGLLARAVTQDDTAAVTSLVAQTHKLLDGLAGDKAMFADRAAVDELRGRCYLVEAQKLIALDGAIKALPLLIKAKAHYLAVMPARPEQSLNRLSNIAALLEHVKEWEMAVALYREVATSFPQLPQGRDALLNVARIYEKSLNDPMAALAVYAEYSSRYPADLPYRQLELGYRLRRLGYANLLDFQKRNNLNPDGLMGPNTAATLEEIERKFDEISAANNGGSGVLRGQYVHPAIFRIARNLDSAGRASDAIAAYRMFVNLFPTKSQAGEALLSVARLLRDNLLFEEALGAYAEVIEDFPKGDLTSEAYIESASCLENLGRWKDARGFYELYMKKFPKYKHVELCKTRIALLDEIRQYQDFVTGNPQSPKAAEAQYQLAAILYEKLKNYTKAAVEFQKVAENYPKHVRAVEGLYTAGTALLKVENFPAARNVFSRIVRDYSDSRLADDAQFWTGHTYEYSARALGKLDDKRVVLKRRSLAERQRLMDDMNLRRTYYAKAQAGPQVSDDIWGGDALGVLTSGSTRDRVNADLFRAIEAYRKVVDNFKTGDMAGNSLLRIGTIYNQYLNDPEKGIKAYQELLAHYGATKEAVDALYEVGAYYLKKADYDQAVKAYQQFIYNYPKDERVEDAMLAVAGAHVESKAWDKALDAYQSYLAKYPAGKSAEFAKAQIAWIRMYHF